MRGAKAAATAMKARRRNALILSYTVIKSATRDQQNIHVPSVHVEKLANITKFSHFFIKKSSILCSYPFHHECKANNAIYHSLLGEICEDEGNSNGS